MPDRRTEFSMALRRLNEWASSIRRTFDDPRIPGPIRDSFKTVVAVFEDAIQAVASELEKIRGELNSTRMLVDEHHKSVGKSFTAVRREVALVAKNAESAQRQYVVLNRQMRLSQVQGRKADIDDWASGQAELGVQVAEGREAAQRLRGTTGTQEPAARIKRYRDDNAAYQRHLHEAVAAARDLATVDPTTSRRALAGLLDRWAGNRTEAARLARLLPPAMADACRAQADLDIAEQQRADLRHRAELGDQAERILYQNIDAYLYPVLDGGLVLPIWLDLALGCGIAGRDWRDWLDTAIRLIHYRIVYRVPSGCDALGPRPTTEGRQSTEYDRLRADCAAYHL
ncbi:hypothetical protein OHS18_38360 [Amycolatopsis sp. NBC_00355]|uniref:hypothetical protein n=1 Tax=Amycolatopsis sp. NBC_00355 TaxID=2975957 RepID=UPI002E256D2E